MIVKIQNKNDFVTKFLSPITKINENAVIKIHQDKITSLITTNDETLILYVIYNENNEIVEESYNLNIPDVRLIRPKSLIVLDNLEKKIHFIKNFFKEEKVTNYSKALNNVKYISIYVGPFIFPSFLIYINNK